MCPFLPLPQALGAVMINSHSGHDSWGSGDKALSFFKYALKVEKALDIPIVHETHRRAMPRACAAHVTPLQSRDRRNGPNM
jgi:hypothetical protein